MTQPIPLLVFSDLDGTLLDHKSYSWAPARPAIEALKQMGAGIILASSKTAREIDLLRSNMELDQWPCIVENGAGLLPAHSHDSDSKGQYDKLRKLLDKIPDQLRDLFTGFGDMTDAEVAHATGLTIESAASARAREFSEPGIWHGRESQKNVFLQHLYKAGIHTQQGGRFLTLSFGANKADRLRELKNHYQPLTTVALGDAPNDVDMLESADIAVVVSNPHAESLPILKGEREGHVIRTESPGPNGWNAAILSIIDQLTQETKNQ